MSLTAPTTVTTTAEVDPGPKREPAWGPIGKPVFRRSYARSVVQMTNGDGGPEPVLGDDGRPVFEPFFRPEWLELSDLDENGDPILTETWQQMALRVATGSAALDPNVTINETQELYESLMSMKLMPAGRHLWATGTTTVASRNCFRVGFSPAANADHYCRVFELLMLGGGVGANYSDSYLALPPTIVGELDLSIAGIEEHHDRDLIYEDLAAAIADLHKDGIEAGPWEDAAVHLAKIDEIVADMDTSDETWADGRMFAFGQFAATVGADHTIFGELEMVAERLLDAETPATHSDNSADFDVDRARRDTTRQALRQWVAKTEIEGDAANTHTIGDSREGWSDAVRHLFDLAETPGVHSIAFDVSNVRPFGSVLRTAGGTASGPGPIAAALYKLTALTHRVRETSGGAGRNFDWYEAMLADHYLSECVVAGGKRRSARMSMRLWSDPGVVEFARVKSGNYSMMHTTNISIEVDREFFDALDDPNHPRHDDANWVVSEVSRKALDNGEPGIYNSYLAGLDEEGDVRSTNPCGEIPLELGRSDLGEDPSAGEACNLVHVNLEAAADDLEAEFRRAARFAVRATLIALSDSKVGAIEARNRRIGVGFLGFADWCALNRIPYRDAPHRPDVIEALNLWRGWVRDEADRYADELGIPRPVKVTTLAPTGTISVLAGVQASGQAPNAKFYIRRVRVTEGNSDELANFATEDGWTVEASLNEKRTLIASKMMMHTLTWKAWLNEIDQVNPNGRTAEQYAQAYLDGDRPDWVTEALSRAEALVVTQGELTPAEAIAVQSMFQQYYCSSGDGNSISYTVNLDPSTPVEEIEAGLREFLPTIKGTTFMPLMSEEDMEAWGAPEQPISGDRFFAERGGTVGDIESSCASGACPIR